MSRLTDYYRERVAAVERLNRADLGGDREAERLPIRQRRFRARLLHWLRMALIGSALGGGAYLAIATWSPWPAPETIRHLLAAPNCAAARAVGLAPAYRGDPGYWSRHDADNDGIACEPWP